MKKAVLLSLFVPAIAFAQPKGAIETNQVEAVVTVTKVDHKARTVTIKGPQGNLRTLDVPPEAQNLDKVKPGDRFKMTYAEALVLAVTRGGKPSSSVDRQVTVAPKGGTPGGRVVRTAQVTGVVDAIDYKNRYVALRGPGLVDAYYDRHGAQRDPTEAIVEERLVQLLQEVLDDSALDAERKRGRALTAAAARTLLRQDREPAW